MNGVNKVILVGTLGKDPEVKRTPGGDALANLSVATSESWRDKNSGERKEKTEWHRVTLWGGLAEIAERYLSKGSKVYLEGKLQTRKWQDQSGQDKYSTEVVLQGFGAILVMLGGGKADNRESGSGERSGQPKGENRRPRDTTAAEDLEDEIPF